jgi:hypothetical protein
MYQKIKCIKRCVVSVYKNLKAKVYIKTAKNREQIIYIKTQKR